MKPLAEYMGTTIEDCATQILQKAYEKIEAEREARREAVREIAEIMGETERNVYHYISKAKEIGKQYKEKHGITLD